MRQRGNAEQLPLCFFTHAQKDSPVGIGVDDENKN